MESLCGTLFKGCVLKVSRRGLCSLSFFFSMVWWICLTNIGLTLNVEITCFNPDGCDDSNNKTAIIAGMVL